MSSGDELMVDVAMMLVSHGKWMIYSTQGPISIWYHFSRYIDSLYKDKSQETILYSSWEFLCWQDDLFILEQAPGCDNFHSDHVPWVWVRTVFYGVFLYHKVCSKKLNQNTFLFKQPTIRLPRNFTLFTWDIWKIISRKTRRDEKHLRFGIWCILF